jgi:asparagine synthetase B (glutamine-hydrolysing)
MIIGVVLPHPAPRPRWLEELGLRSDVEGGPATVHLGASGKGSLLKTGPLTVVVESSEVDAQTIAEAYAASGVARLRRVPGRFRFLLHDARAQRFVAANSMTPPWPLTYWADSRAAVVCSRLASLIRCPLVPRRLDESHLLHLILGLSAMREGSTIIRGVRRLCPGEALFADAGGVRVLRVDRLEPRQVAGNREQLRGLFAEELTKAIRRHAEGRRSVLSLSGGLDSAALAGLELRRADKVSALSFVAPTLDHGAESSAIDAMQRAWRGLDVTRLDTSDATDLPDLGLDLRDDPLLTPLALLPARMRLWSKARDTGFRTVLEGEGGDELFSMIPTPYDALRSGHILEAARHVLASTRRRALVQSALWLPMLPGTMQRAWLARHHRVEAYLPAFATWDARERPAVREAVTEHLATLVHRPFEARLHEWLSAPTFVGAALSRRQLAASFGLDLEWPLLERPVLELVLGLHEAHAIHGGQNKPFLRDALVGTVPDEVRLAEKNIGLYRALIPRVLCSQRSRESLRDARVRARLAGLIRFERAESMLDALASGRSLSPSALWQLECLVSFAEWYGRASRDHGVD